MDNLNKEKQYCHEKMMKLLEKNKLGINYPTQTVEYWKGRLDQLNICAGWIKEIRGK